jgi:hypothetical protein
MTPAVIINGGFEAHTVVVMKRSVFYAVVR